MQKLLASLSEISILDVRTIMLLGRSYSLYGSSPWNTGAAEKRRNRNVESLAGLHWNRQVPPAAVEPL